MKHLEHLKEYWTKKHVFQMGILFAILLCFSQCRTVQPVVENNGETLCWAIKMDSINSSGTHFIFLDNSRDCFPEVNEEKVISKDFSISVYDRWGNQLYKSIDIRENWVCNHSSRSDIKSGTYFYSIQYRTAESPDVLLKKNGTIDIYFK